MISCHDLLISKYSGITSRWSQSHSIINRLISNSIIRLALVLVPLLQFYICLRYLYISKINWTTFFSRNKNVCLYSWHNYKKDTKYTYKTYEACNIIIMIYIRLGVSMLGDVLQHSGNSNFLFSGLTDVTYQGDITLSLPPLFQVSKIDDIFRIYR